MNGIKFEKIYDKDSSQKKKTKKRHSSSERGRRINLGDLDGLDSSDKKKNKEVKSIQKGKKNYIKQNSMVNENKKRLNRFNNENTDSIKRKKSFEKRENADHSKDKLKKLGPKNMNEIQNGNIRKTSTVKNKFPSRFRNEGFGKIQEPYQLKDNKNKKKNVDLNIKNVISEDEPISSSKVAKVDPDIKAFLDSMKKKNVENKSGKSKSHIKKFRPIQNSNQTNPKKNSKSADRRLLSEIIYNDRSFSSEESEESDSEDDSDDNYDNGASLRRSMGANYRMIRPKRPKLKKIKSSSDFGEKHKKRKKFKQYTERRRNKDIRKKEPFYLEDDDNINIRRQYTYSKRNNFNFLKENKNRLYQEEDRNKKNREIQKKGTFQISNKKNYLFLKKISKDIGGKSQNKNNKIEKREPWGSNKAIYEKKKKNSLPSNDQSLRKNIMDQIQPKNYQKQKSIENRNRNNLNNELDPKLKRNQSKEFINLRGSGRIRQYNNQVRYMKADPKLKEKGSRKYDLLVRCPQTRTYEPKEEEPEEEDIDAFIERIKSNYKQKPKKKKKKGNLIYEDNIEEPKEERNKKKKGKVHFKFDHPLRRLRNKKQKEIFRQRKLKEQKDIKEERQRERNEKNYSRNKRILGLIFTEDVNKNKNLDNFRAPYIVSEAETPEESPKNIKKKKNYAFFTDDEDNKKPIKKSISKKEIRPKKKKTFFDGDNNTNYYDYLFDDSKLSLRRTMSLRSKLSYRDESCEGSKIISGKVKDISNKLKIKKFTFKEEKPSDTYLRQSEYSQKLRSSRMPKKDKKLVIKKFDEDYKKSITPVTFPIASKYLENENDKKDDNINEEFNIDNLDILDDEDNDLFNTGKKHNSSSKKKENKKKVKLDKSKDHKKDKPMKHLNTTTNNNLRGNYILNKKPNKETVKSTKSNKNSRNIKNGNNNYNQLYLKTEPGRGTYKEKNNKKDKMSRLNTSQENRRKNNPREKLNLTSQTDPYVCKTSRSKNRKNNNKRVNISGNGQNPKKEKKIKGLEIEKNKNPLKIKKPNLEKNIQKDIPYYDGPVDLSYISSKNYQEAISQLEDRVRPFGFRCVRNQKNNFQFSSGYISFYIDIVKLKNNYYYYLLSKTDKNQSKKKE